MDASKSATTRFLEANQADRASDFIFHLVDVLRENPNRCLVLLCRVSTETQKRNGNLRDDREWALAQLEGCKVIAVFEEVGSAYVTRKRPILEQAIAYAKAHDAIVVTTSRDRLLRHQDFDGSNATERPTDREYLILTRKDLDVDYATIVPPNRRGRSRQTRRGIAAKGRSGGRPRTKAPGYKRKERDEKLPRALVLRDDGCSIRVTAKKIGVKKSTVQDWFRKY